eukprot:PLAT5230.1.p3 GENE.PLAT5230.1~~PLAT5230.1.p3  ORF type:complete len:127 (+),score=77.55 PLAT5230.1:2-382(+)
MPLLLPPEDEEVTRCMSPLAELCKQREDQLIALGGVALRCALADAADDAHRKSQRVQHMSDRLASSAAKCKALRKALEEQRQESAQLLSQLQQSNAVIEQLMPADMTGAAAAGSGARPAAEKTEEE